MQSQSLTSNASASAWKAETAWAQGVGRNIETLLDISKLSAPRSTLRLMKPPNQPRRLEKQSLLADDLAAKRPCPMQ